MTEARPRADGDRRSASGDPSRSDARFLIVGTGRSGSSLLAAILASAGADFGLPARERWDAREGALEHPALDRAWTWRARAERLRALPVPNALGRRPALRLADRALRRALREARYLKSSHLVRMVGAVAGLGYAPRILISYRDFPGYARSRYRKHGWSWARLEASYVDAYRTALLALDRYGGCAVDYAELTDRVGTGWADRLASVTGLDRTVLCEARDRIADRSPAPAPEELASAEADAVYRALRGLAEPGGS